jgi:hypothetical protein
LVQALVTWGGKQRRPPDSESVGASLMEPRKEEGHTADQLVTVGQGCTRVSRLRPGPVRQPVALQGMHLRNDTGASECATVTDVSHRREQLALIAVVAGLWVSCELR